MIEIVPYHPAHWPLMRDRLDEMHRLRMETAGEVDDVLALALSVSRLTRTGLIDGRPECIMGMGVIADVGYPWLIKTDEAMRRFRPLVRHAHRFIAECLRERALLRADVLPEDETLPHWLRWLGFDQVAPGCWELEDRHGH